jgi:long-chain acyl-CoA synthetase
MHRLEYGTWPSLTAMFFELAKAHGERPLAWAKKDGSYRPWTWQEVERQVRLLARALRARGLGDGDRVVLVSENRPEWLIADLAVMAAGGITVPAYTTNTEIDHRYIMTDSGAMAVIVSTPALAQRVLPAVTDSHTCHFMVTMAPPEFDQLHEAEVVTWDDMLAEGAVAADEVDDQLARIHRDEVACFIYTSGTGGAPKGVMLTHRNILANCAGAHDLLEQYGLGEEVFLSFLPLSHAYEHTAGQFFPLSIGAEIYYAESADKLLNNLAEARPTIMTAVPRLYESMHQRICRAMAKESGTRRRLFELTLKLGTKRAKRGRLNLVERLLDLLVERLVRAKMRKRFGGRLKAMVSGGAALNLEIGQFFTAMGLPILQGYGQTEAAPTISANPPRKVKMETVGPPLKGVEVRIAEDGEILVRGDLVMKGYWRADDATEAAIQDGWLHTGDVGEFDEDGYLKITDRKKDIIVFSGGDNVSPARVEGILTLEPEISQAMVYGDKRPHLVALLVPEDDFLKRWAKTNGSGTQLAELAGLPEFHKAFVPVVERVNAKLANLEKVRRWAISPEPFTVDNGLMTPTLKIRRHKIKAAHGKTLEELY